MELRRITFDRILPVWENKLWPNRESEIREMSSMVYKGGTDMSIYEKYTPTFWGVFDGDRVIGVNSGFRTSDDMYRSRGIWVDPEYRRRGVSRMLFRALNAQAIQEHCSYIWSIPRRSALGSYQRAGFQQSSEFFDEGMEFGPNCYVIKPLWM